LGNKPSEFIAKETARTNYEQQLELMYSKRQDTNKLAKFLKSKGRASHLNPESPKKKSELKSRNKQNQFKSFDAYFKPFVPDERIA
jgi:hypothetical protein